MGRDHSSYTITWLSHLGFGWGVGRDHSSYTITWLSHLGFGWGVGRYHSSYLITDDDDDDDEGSRSDAWGVARSDVLDVSRSESLTNPVSTVEGSHRGPLACVYIHSIYNVYILYKYYLQVWCKHLQSNTNINPATAAACDRRFCSSSVSRTRRCDSCSKSLNVTNLEMH